MRSESGRPKGRRAISPVVGIVILMLMTVAAGGMAYLAIVSYQETSQTEVSGGIERIVTQAGQQVKVESVKDGTIYMRNIGTSTITDMRIYADGREVGNCDNVEKNKYCIIRVNQTIACGSDHKCTLTVGTATGATVTGQTLVDEEELEFDEVYSITNFSDGSSAKTIIFTSPDSEIVNITLPTSASISSAEVDLQGSRQWNATAEEISESIESRNFEAVVETDSNANVHVAWRGATSPRSEIYYRNLSQSSWSNIEMISADFPGSDNSFEVRLLIDSSDNIHTVFDDDPDIAYSDIFYTNQTSGIWSEPLNISKAPISVEPAMAFDSNENIHVVWVTSTSIYYKNRTSGAWSSNTLLSSFPTGMGTDMPEIAVDSNDNIHVVWGQDVLSTGDNLEVHYMNRTGGSWSTPMNVSNTGPAGFHSRYPTIAVDSNDNLHVVWTEFESGAVPYTYYSNFSNGAWSTPSRLSSVTYSYEPIIKFNEPDELHVFWYSTGTFIIYHKNRTSGVWSPDYIAHSSSSPERSYFSFDKYNNIHLVFDDNSGSEDIFYKPLTHPFNPTMIAGSAGSNDWSYSNYLNTSTSISDFSTKLNSILSSCSCSSCYLNGTDCILGLNFTSQSAGKIELSNLQVTYTLGDDD